MHHFLLPAIWGLLGFASWIGWGRLIGRWIDREKSFDVGVLAGWGMSLQVAIGGVLNLTRCCGYTATISLVAGGCICLLTSSAGVSPVFPLTRLKHQLSRPQHWIYSLYILVALFVYGASVCWMADWNPIDEYPAYLIFPLKMLHSGAAIEPFSMRRMSTFGGYAFLQTVVSPFHWPTCAFLLDIGLGGIGTSLIVMQWLRSRRESDWFIALAGIAFLCLPIPRINSMTVMLIVFGVLVLYRTLQLREEVVDAKSRRRLLITATFGSAALIAMRPILIPFVGLSIVLLKLFGVLQKKTTAATAARECVSFLAVVTIVLIPWSLSLYIATNSPLWPVVRGNFNASVDFNNAHLAAGPLIQLIANVLIQPATLLAILTAVFGIMFFRPLPTAMWLAAFITTIWTVKSFTLADVQDLSRYTMPMMLPVGTAMLLSTFAAGPATRVRAIGRYALLAACLLLLAADVISPDRVAWFKSWDTGVLHPAAPNGSEGNYQLAQTSVLPGKTILNLTAVPFYFDFARNPIFGLDWPGMASPPPGLPLGRGPEALRDYLRAQSIDYLICNDFDAMTHRSMASRPFMKERMSRPGDYDLHVLTDQRIIPTVLQTMADIDALAQLNPPIYHENRLRVIPIAAPKSASDGGSPK